MDSSEHDAVVEAVKEEELQGMASSKDRDSSQCWKVQTHNANDGNILAVKALEQ